MIYQGNSQHGNKLLFVQTWFHILFTLQQNWGGGILDPIGGEIWPKSCSNTVKYQNLIKVAGIAPVLAKEAADWSGK